MAVVIQDFEAISEPASSQAAPRAEEAGTPAEAIDRDALEHALRRRAELRLRRWAH